MTRAKNGGSQSHGGDDMMAVSRHPRARRQVRLAKGWGGLLGFVIVAGASVRSGVPASEAAIRALVGGLVAYLLVWAVAVYVWRQLVLAEAHSNWKRLADEGGGEPGGEPDGQPPPQRAGA